MNDDSTYQNQDLTNLNPLTPRASTSTEPTPSNTQKAHNKLTLPSDPRIKLLIILFSLVIVLSILSIFVTIFRKATPTIKVATPTITSAPLPTDVPDTTSIPAELKAKFDAINLQTQVKIDFNPPQIDTTVGL